MSVDTWSDEAGNYRCGQFLLFQNQLTDFTVIVCKSVIFGVAVPRTGSLAAATRLSVS